MKIKIAILEQDAGYLSRITNVFNVRYADKLEVYSFTTYEGAMEALDTKRIDVLLADDSFEIDEESLPRRCGFAYLVDSAGIESVRDCVAICKFQKADLIYKQILGVYSEKAESISKLSSQVDEDCSVIAFMSPAGGVGTSSIAAACARRFEGHGVNVFYLNLEKFGTGDAFFSGEGQATLSDVIFSLKGKRTNLQMKLESCLKRDASGVNFFSGSQIALDMIELNADDILTLLSALKMSGYYKYIILDMDFDMGKEFMKIQNAIRTIVMVSDGSDFANTKLFRAVEALETLERSSNTALLNRFGVIYNKFRSKGAKTLNELPLATVGGAPLYMDASEQQIIQQLSSMEFFDVLF